MKKRIMIALIAIPLLYKSQNKVGYAYDNNGNRIQRYFVGLKPAKDESNEQDSLQSPQLAAVNPEVEHDERLIAMKKGITVYPNPTKDLITVTIVKAGVTERPQAKLILSDNTGKIIEEKVYNGSDLIFDFKRNPPGSYYLKIIFENNEKVNYNIIKVN